MAAERYNPKFFAEFRSRNIVELALDYARVGIISDIDVHMSVLHDVEMLQNIFRNI